jgi:hypothetical protein
MTHNGTSRQLTTDQRDGMDVSEADASAGSGSLRWGLRRYAPVVAGCILFVSLALPWALRQDVQVSYEAQALVVAQTSEMPLAALPRYSEAVFYNGAVARQVAAALDAPGDPLGLVPDHLYVITGQDSVVMTVVGRHPEPGVAAQIANQAANAYVTELNRPGPELGTFALQSAAAAPVEPVDSGPSTSLGLVIGGLAGTALGLGLLGLLLIVRRPIVDQSRFENLVGAPVLGVLTLPRRPGQDVDARRVQGLAPLVRRLVSLPPGVVHVVSTPGLAQRRAAVASLLARALARWRPTVLSPVASDGQQPAVSKNRSLDVGQYLVIVDIDRALDVRPTSRRPATLLLLEEGAPERVVLRVVAEYVDADVLGVVILRTGRLPSLPARSDRVTEHAVEQPEVEEHEDAVEEHEDAQVEDRTATKIV